MRKASSLWLALATTVSVFSASQTAFAANAPVESQPSDTPVRHFAKIEDGLYRSAGIKTQEEYNALKKMGVRVVMSLEWKKSLITAEAAMAKKAGIHFISEPMLGLTPSDAQINEIEGLMKDNRFKPMLIHCAAGRERTGLVTGIYRVETNKWDPKLAYKEMVDMGFRNTVGFFLRQYFEKRTHTNL